MDWHHSAQIGPTFAKAREKIHHNTREFAKFYDLAGSCRRFEKLKTPPRPRLEEVGFYDGGNIPESDYTPQTIRVTNVAKSDILGCSAVELETLLTKFKSGQITFVGPAGSGKTTLLKSICEGVLDKQFLEGIRLVCSVQCANFPVDRLVTARDLLFYNPDNSLSQDELEEAVRFATSFPQQTLFVIDALDTLRFTLDGVYEVVDDVNERACPEAVLSNFLADNLFPGCRIISSSREHGIRNFKGEVRSSKVIALVGLSMESIKAIIEGYVGNEEAENVLERLRTKSPAQLSLCTTPVLLAYTLIGLETEGRKFDPTTMTGILIIVLQCFLRSPYFRQNRVLFILRKLAELAYNGIIGGRVNFLADEIEEIGLDPVEATDLAILSPTGARQKILRGSSLLFFSHLSLQELLATIHISQMLPDSYDELLSGKIHTPPFSVIRRFLCGILCDGEVFEEAECLIEDTSDIERKRSTLKNSLVQRLPRTTRGPDFLELLLSLHEGKSGMKNIIMDHLHKLDFEDLPLSKSDIFAVGSVMSFCKHISELDLQNCNLDRSSTTFLESILDHSDMKLSQMWLGRNPRLGVEGVSSVGRMSVKHSVKKLHFFQCQLKPDELHALEKSLGTTQLSLLDLSGNTNMGTDGIVSARNIVQNCRVEHFDLQKCRLTSPQLKALSQFDAKTKIAILRLNEKMTASHEEVLAVANIIPQVTETISLYGWTLTAADRSLLQDTLCRNKDTNLTIRFTGQPNITNMTEKISSKSGDQESEETIGPEGGTMKVGFCRVIFPPRAIRKPRLIEVLVVETPRPCPTDFVAISHQLRCEPSMIFDAPVTLNLPTWCTTQFEDVFVSIMSAQGEEDEYRVIDRLKLVDCVPFITFECNHFTRFWALIERIFLGRVQFLVHIAIYHDQQGNFTVILHAEDESYVDDSMAKQGFSKAPAFFDQRAIYLHDNLSFALVPRGQGRFTFNPPEVNDFQLGSQFEDCRRKHFQFILDPIPNPGELLKINATLGHKQENVPVNFNLRWSDHQNEPVPGQQQTNPTHLTIVEGNQIVDNSYRDQSFSARDITADTVAAGGTSIQSDQRGAVHHIHQ